MGSCFTMMKLWASTPPPTWEEEYGPWVEYSAAEWEQWDEYVRSRRALGPSAPVWTKIEWAVHYGVLLEDW